LYCLSVVFIDELSDFSFGMVILLYYFCLSLLPKQLEMFMEIEDSANALSLYSIWFLFI